MFTGTSNEKLTNRAKYLSNSVNIIPNKNVVPTIFKRYYSWLTNSKNLYDMTIGVIVKQFCLFGISEVDPNEPSSKSIYVRALESIAYGIIKSVTNSESLGLFDYINYQIRALEKLFKVQADIKDEEMIKVYRNLFSVQDIDNDGKLGIRDLTVSLAYLDMQDGKLTGKFDYRDAINLGENLDTDIGKFKMRLELNNLKELLYG